MVVVGVFFVLKKTHLKTGAFGTGFLFLAVWAFSFAIHPSLGEWREKGLVVSKVATREKVVALTFDDGPDPAATPEVLKILGKNNARATFFLIGVHAEKYPDLVKQIKAQGHEIGNHGYSHQIKRYNDFRFARADVERAGEIIASLTGQRPRLLRPPGGFLSHDLVNYTRSHGLQIVTWTWDADLKDWRATNSSRLASDLVKKAKPGYILILHDGGSNRKPMLQALEKVLPELSARGFRFITVSELMTLTNK